MKAFAVDVYCPQFDRWVRALTDADRKLGAAYKSDADYQAGLKGIQAWDGYANADSPGALKYYYWRNTLHKKLGQQANAALIARVNDYLDLFGWSKKQEPVTEADEKALIEALAEAMKRMRANHNSLDAVYGDVFRVGRDDQSWPVAGGTLIHEGMATLRSIGFGEERADHTRWGGPSSGQSSTEVIILSKPIRSFTQPPIGQSDRKDSPHYRDQAEKLFSRGKMKSTWFAKEELLDGHVKSQIELTWPKKQTVER